MAKRWGIKVAALSGLVALVALTAFPAVCWKEILIRYYEVVLRKEPNRCVHFLPPHQNLWVRFLPRQRGKPLGQGIRAHRKASPRAWISALKTRGQMWVAGRGLGEAA